MILGHPRHAVLLALLLPLAACAGSGPEAPQTFAPLSYGYLTPLHLDVATLAVEDHAVPQGPSDVADRSPVPPAQALEQMARDRIFPGGGAGAATFVVDQASILRRGDRLDGRLAVHLDLVNGGRNGHAEAQVSRTVVGGTGDLRARLYALTRQMMDDMNVEFEYQVRHSLPTWLQSDGVTPVAVTAQPLGGPPAAAVPAVAPAMPPAATSPVAASATMAPPAAPPAAAAPTPLTVPSTAPSGAAGVTMSPPPGVLTAPSGMRPVPVPPFAAAQPGPTPLAAPTPYQQPATPAYAPPPTAGTYGAPGAPAYGTSAIPPPAYAVPAPTY